jgi:hypothetical protein
MKCPEKVSQKRPGVPISADASFDVLSNLIIAAFPPRHDRIFVEPSIDRITDKSE